MTKRPSPEQPKQLPQLIAQPNGINKDFGPKDEFKLDEDFFLIDNDESDIISDYNKLLNGEIPKQQPVYQQPPLASPEQYLAPGSALTNPPINAFKDVSVVYNLPIKIRYTNEDFTTFQMNELVLAKTLLSIAFSKYNDLSFELYNDAYGLYRLTIFKNGNSIKPYYIIDIASCYGGKGMPVMYGTVGAEYPYPGNIRIIPLGFIQGIQECIECAAYRNGINGLSAISEAKLNMSMLEDHIYRTIDFSIETLPDDFSNYKAFGELIKKIDKVYPLKARYRLYNYHNNQDFTLISDNFVKPFDGLSHQAPPTGVTITISGNNLAVKEPNGNINYLQIGA